MRLLSLIPLMGAGGAEAVVAMLATDARSRGDEVRVASGGGFRVDALVAGGGVARLDLRLDGRRPTDLARSVGRLRAVCRPHRPDLVHAHNVKATLVGRLGVGRSTPVLTTLHGIPERDYAAAAQILRRCSDRVVAVSPYVADRLVGGGFPAERLTVVENAIAPARRPPRAAARARLDLPEQRPVVLCVARLADQKRHDLLVEAWARVPDEAFLLVAGDGPTRPAIETAVRAAGLGERIRLLGERHDVDWLLSATDLVVLPTDWEGLPVSLLEAMGAGVPVLASRVGDVARTLGPGVQLVDPGSADALAEGLAGLIRDPAARADLGRRGQQLVAARFGADEMLAAYRALYDQLAHPAGNEARR